jgi:hypothetical protein
MVLPSAAGAAATPGGVTKALQLLQFLYNAMPSQVRLVLAESVSTWAERAKAQALAELAGGPQSPPTATPHDFTTVGHSRPY